MALLTPTHRTKALWPTRVTRWPPILDVLISISAGVVLAFAMADAFEYNYTTVGFAGADGQWIEALSVGSILYVMSWFHHAYAPRIHDRTNHKPE